MSESTTGWTEIHFSLAVIFRFSGPFPSKERKNVSIFPRKALLGRWIFIYRELYNKDNIPGIPVNVKSTGIPGKKPFGDFCGLIDLWI